MIVDNCKKEALKVGLRAYIDHYEYDVFGINAPSVTDDIIYEFYDQLDSKKFIDYYKSGTLLDVFQLGILDILNQAIKDVLEDQQILDTDEIQGRDYFDEFDETDDEDEEETDIND